MQFNSYSKFRIENTLTIDVDNDWPPGPRLQPLTHPSFPVVNKSKFRETEAERVYSDYNDPDLLLANEEFETKAK
jgi:hypothetical protein